MKWARVVAGGRERTCVWREDDGLLVDAGGEAHRPDEVVWLPPVRPRQVVGLALNFREHAAELQLEAPEEPTLFLKPVSSLVGHRAPVVRPPGVEMMHYEVELAVVIGREARRVPAGRAYDYVRGYTIANDVTAREFIRNMYRPPVRAKGWDTFGPIGPFLVDRDDIPDPGDLELRAFVNGELCQRGRTSELIHDVPRLIEFVTSFMTLRPGDVILTGTPRGIRYVAPGDVMRLEIDGLGALENPVV